MPLFASRAVYVSKVLLLVGMAVVDVGVMGVYMP